MACCSRPVECSLVGSGQSVLARRCLKLRWKVLGAQYSERNGILSRRRDSLYSLLDLSSLQHECSLVGSGQSRRCSKLRWKVLGAQYSERDGIVSRRRDYLYPLLDLSSLQHEPVGPSIPGMNGELARHSASRELDLTQSFSGLHFRSHSASMMRRESRTADVTRAFGCD